MTRIPGFGGVITGNWQSQPPGILTAAPNINGDWDQEAFERENLKELLWDLTIGFGNELVWQKVIIAKETVEAVVDGRPVDAAIGVAEFACDTAVICKPVRKVGRGDSSWVRRIFNRNDVNSPNATVPNEVPKIGDRKPINSRYAGQNHPSGVKFNERGFPDFSPHAKAEVELSGLTGNYAKDAAAANRAVELDRTPDGYVWHHVEDGRTMQLVPRDIHNAARHTGGAAVIRHGDGD